MTLEELRDYYKTWATMTRKLELGATTYLRWRKNGFIPYNTQLIIQDKTKGKFKASKAHCIQKEALTD